VIQFINSDEQQEVRVSHWQAMLDVVTQVPNPGPVAPPGMSGPANQLLGWLKWVGIIAGMVGLGICAIMMILGRRNRSNMAVDGATGIPWVLGGLSLMALSAGLVGAVLT
jgi:hypothetical protein